MEERHVGSGLPGSRPRLRLRPTMLSDLDFVISVETDALNLPFITPWDRTQHEGAVRFSGTPAQLKHRQHADSLEQAYLACIA